MKKFVIYNFVFCKRCMARKSSHSYRIRWEARTGSLLQKIPIVLNLNIKNFHYVLLKPREKISWSKTILFNGCETWRTIKKSQQRIQQRIQFFVNGSLQTIFRIGWLTKVPNEELWQRADQEPKNEVEIKVDRTYHAKT